MTTRTCSWGKHRLTFGHRTLLMGIVNVTPDSFSDGGSYFSVQRAVRHGEELVADGADILDIGGESTRPGYSAVSVEEELQRVIPVIEELSQRVQVPMSIDTQKAEVAERAIQAGAAMINDIWGGKGDPEMIRMAARYDVPLIMTHNRETPCKDRFMETLIDELAASIQMAVDAGVSKNHIIVDPGIGFGKTYEQNLEAIRELDRLSELGCPVLLGTSRKSVIGHTLKLSTDEREEGTAATVAIGIAQGADIVRVHDVRAMSRVAKMTDALVRTS